MDTWYSTWGYQPIDVRAFPITVWDETQRILVKNNLQGDKVRVLFSNVNGTTPLCFERVLLAPSPDGITVCKEQTVTITFEENDSVVLAPGEEKYSDAIIMQCKAGEYLAVSTYVRGKSTITTGFGSNSQNITINQNCCDGDYCDEAHIMHRPRPLNVPFLQNMQNYRFFYGLRQIEVCSKNDVKTIVAFGDSLTHMALWTAPLAQRLYQRFPSTVTLLNAGISGNRILHDTSTIAHCGNLFGSKGIDRFEQDVFGRSSVNMVILLEGSNDIYHPAAMIAPESESVTADQIIQGLLHYVQIAHSHHAKIVGCTLPPIGVLLPAGQTEKTECIRSAVNDWIRNSGEFDLIVDVDNCLLNPDNPITMMLEYDSGDHLHPSTLGGQKIADTFDINVIAKLLF